jgi:uncharacterized membrane protein YfcA
MGDALVVAAIVLLAATTQSATGFGYALVAAPLLTVVVGPLRALPVLWLTFLPVSVAMAVQLRAEIRWTIVRRMGLVGAVTTLIGAWALDDVPSRALQAVTGVSVLAFVLAPAPRREAGPSGPRTDLLAGGIAGLLGATIGTNGPPLVIALSRRGFDRVQLSATLAGVFTVLAVVTLGVLAIAGRLTADVWTLLPASVPSLAVGTGLGSFLVRRVPERVTAVTVRVLLVASGLACLAKAVLP